MSEEIDRIRGLVRRWVAWRGVEPKSSHTAAYLQLDTYEREALMGWVRRRMEREGVQCKESIDYELHAGIIARELDLELELAYALCEAAGWPS